MPDSLPTRLTALLQRGIAALVRHARDPRRFGAADEHERCWLQANEARYALAESNPVFAGRLLPAVGATGVAGEGVPTLPVGVRHSVDEVKQGHVLVTADIAGIVGATATVTPPAGLAFSTPVTALPTRLSVQFNAPQDGVYRVQIRTGSAPLVTLLVPVSRAVFRALREDSRALSYLTRQTPAATPDYRLRLALLLCGEAAAQTGDAATATQFLGDALRVTQAAHPVALHPTARG